MHFKPDGIIKNHNIERLTINLPLQHQHSLFNCQYIHTTNVYMLTNTTSDTHKNAIPLDHALKDLQIYHFH
jgi:hypothetical protein